MDKINDKLLQAANGEHRLKPQEQKKYLGTFAERVVLTVSLTDAKSQLFQDHFAHICQELIARYQQLAVKINGQLPISQQMTLMKIAQTANLPTTVINEEHSHSPYGLIIHSSQAQDLTTTDVRECFPTIFEPKTAQTQPKQSSFWQRLFGK